MKGAPLFASGLLLASATLVASTRVPGPSPWQELAVGVALALAVAAVLALRGARPWLPGAAMALLAVGLLLPESRAAWLAGTPAAAVGLVCAAAFLAVHRTGGTQAPRVDTHERAPGLRHALRYAPPFALMALLALLPLLLAVLPARLASAYELAGAAGPAAAAVAIAVPMLALAFAVRALWGPRHSEPTAPPAPVAAAPPPAEDAE